MRHLDIDFVRHYLKSAGINFNDDDEIVANGTLDELTGHVKTLGGHGPTIRFTLYARDNGIFIDYHNGYDKSFIKPIS